MKRQYQSGTQKRKIKKEREEETKSMAGSLLKFIQNPVPSIKNKSENRKEDEKKILIPFLL